MKITNPQRQKVLNYLKAVYVDPLQPAPIRQQALNAFTWVTGLLPAPTQFASQLRELVRVILGNTRCGVRRTSSGSVFA